jgi:hypothetical protein
MKTKLQSTHQSHVDSHAIKEERRKREYNSLMSCMSSASERRS